MYAKKAEDLLIYKFALEYSVKIAELVKSIPYHWNIEEVDQILRCSSSVPVNIAEGFSQRFYNKKFLYYLNIALGSSDETQSHLRKLGKDRHIYQKLAEEWIRKYKNLSVRIVNFLNHLSNRKKTQ